jgi:PAS domain S-box-containing protein
MSRMTNLHAGTGAPVPSAEALLTRGDLAGERIQTYQLLFDANPQPMWVFDRNTLGMLAVNEAAVAHYGYSREEFLSLSLLDIRRTLGGARVDAEQIERESADASGHLLPTRWKHACKDGRLIDVEVRASNVELGRQAARLVLVNDLSERVSLERQRRAALADSAASRKQLTHALDRETDFRLLVEQLPALIYRATLDGSDRTLYISPYVHMLGHTVDNWLADSQTWPRSLHPDDRDQTLAALARAYENGDDHAAEYRMRDAQGNWRHFKDVSQRFEPEDGSTAYIQGIALDITDLEESKAALQEAEAYRRTLFEQLADGVLLIGPGNSVLEANPQALAMLGYAGESVSSLSMRALLVDVLPEVLTESLLKHPLGQILRMEWTLQRRDGSRLPVEVSMRALDPQRHLAVLRDITERRATQAALLTYQLELSDLTQKLLIQEKNTTRRLARSLHDHLGQTLAVARLNLDRVLVTSTDGMSPDLLEQCGHISKLLAQAVQEVRHVLADLRPPLLEEQGLAAALDNETRSQPMSAGVADVLLEPGDGVQSQRWPPDVEYSAFMIAREAIVNARLHAQASLIRVVLEGDDNSLSLDVIDDGNGISAELRHGRPGHLGVVGMRERAISIGARFALTAGPDGGTQVRMRWDAPQP